jgi:hypothetical protein
MDCMGIGAPTNLFGCNINSVNYKFVYCPIIKADVNALDIG